jgi:hypothetical protein
MEEAVMNTATMIEATELDDRIAAAFRDGATSDQVGSLIEEVEAALVGASDAAKQARVHALDPAVVSADAAFARGRMEDAAFRHDRLNNAVTRLSERLRVVEAQEEDHRRRLAYDKSKAQRDKLAAELKATYPAITAQLADLMARIAANDREIEYINAYALPESEPRLLVAELVARDLPGWVENSVHAARITTELRLPAFGFDAHRPYVWPTAC